MKTAMMMAIVMCATCVARADTTVNVTPSNQHGWTLNVFDGNGNVATGNVGDAPYNGGTAQLVSGPATPPGGAGSVHLATAANGGDGAAAVATEQFDGTLLSSITSLSYSTYDIANNGQQMPYMAISIDTHTAAGIDTLFFEPPYQQTSTGNPSLPDQNDPGASNSLPFNTWQTWNVFSGGFWDNNGVDGPGTGVGPLSDFTGLYPNATIANGGFPDLGGIAMQVGFAGSSDNFDGYVANFEIGVNGVNTDYEFGPNSSSTPLPASVWEGTALFAVVGVVSMIKRRKLA